ncbi:MAG TPA: DUF2490 domain-containing protein [Gammaproteobacteria bacterium]
MATIRGGRRIFSPAAALIALIAAGDANSQVDEDQLGGWYAYSLKRSFSDSRWGLHFDAAYRSFDVADDLQQKQLRAGLTLEPESGNVVWTFGYLRGAAGEFGESNEKTRESRLYQEAVVSQTAGTRVFLAHRFRFEQRWVDGQGFHTRFRYGLFADIPLNGTDLGAGAFYLHFYNEILLAAGRDRGKGNGVGAFDSDRLFAGVGYSFSDTLKLRGGYMYRYTDSVDKGQLLISLSQSL